jgi:hypothetical protein
MPPVRRALKASALTSASGKMSSDDDLPEAPPPPPPPPPVEAPRPTLRAVPRASVHTYELSVGTVPAAEMVPGWWYVYHRTGPNVRFRKMSAKKADAFLLSLKKDLDDSRSISIAHEVKRMTNAVCVTRVRRGVTQEGAFWFKDEAVLPGDTLLSVAPPDFHGFPEVREDPE